MILETPELKLSFVWRDLDQLMQNLKVFEVHWLTIALEPPEEKTFRVEFILNYRVATLVNVTAKEMNEFMRTAKIVYRE